MKSSIFRVEIFWLVHFIYNLPRFSFARNWIIKPVNWVSQKESGIIIIEDNKRSSTNLAKYHFIINWFSNNNKIYQIIIKIRFVINWRITGRHNLWFAILLNHSLPRIWKSGSERPCKPKGVVKSTSKNNPVIPQTIIPRELSRNTHDIKKNNPGKYKNIPHLDNLELTRVSRQIINRLTTKIITTLVFLLFNFCNS